MERRRHEKIAERVDETKREEWKGDEKRRGGEETSRAEQSRAEERREENRERRGKERIGEKINRFVVMFNIFFVSFCYRTSNIFVMYWRFARTIDNSSQMQDQV